MKIIGLSGQKRNGKSATLAALVKNYKNIIPYSFARPLKECCKILFGGTDEHWYGKDKETELEIWKASPRKLMQLVGTELFRNNFDRNFWIKVAEVHIERIRNYHEIVDSGNVEFDPIIVIDDVRFENEAELILGKGGKIYNIRNINIPIVEPTHESEVPLHPCYISAELHAASLEEVEGNAHFIAKDNGLCLITTP